MAIESLDPPAPDPTSIAPLPRISLQAFCESAELAATINEAADDRRMEKTHVKVNMGGAHAAVEAYRTSPTPNVIVLETNASRAELLGHLEALAEYCDAGTKVVVVGRHNDIPLYRELMARAVSEYLVQPIDVLDFISALSSLYNQDVAAPLGRIIAVTGCKGGVGASCVSHNLAWSIARDLDSATVIVDLDLPFGTTGLDFNQDPPQGIAEAVFSPDRLDGNLLDRLLSKCSDKLSILAAPATIERAYDLPETAFDPLLEILRGSTPHIILDVPHVWTAWSRRLLSTADETVIVASPELASLRNVKSLLDNLRGARRNDPAPRIVLNGVGMPRRPEISSADFAKAIEAEPSVVVPFDAKLFGAAANNGQMIAEVEEGARIAAIFQDLARLATGRAAIKRERKGLFDPLLAVFKG
ncbi:AAA family ATPase [Rhodoblastus acidophilus]|uniref:AAA family ATPase n=1 Tax=Candidatus Rhodoblastus alkanivorans TaxID=2954117 RepID=A0ABS9ZEB5_9HYPH|nr:AAA family ATPase [Candidatus Rhodoblastus alkanivorans]MCI4677805.1 AAA family ATPase [Candidatus Rhodoblastus alkanivorans]MCI4684697.1 AAA family ATPase [Candidatus Rhodoblastus alkanivorans]MDI4642019.1 AAA family ATPase [Rhodoblastus acidophilus]